MDEKVSIIIPVYNVEKYIRRCVESVIHQSYKNLEIILIDDGSTDKSSAICDEYGVKDDRVKVIHKNNGGLSDARNVGLDIARGDYILFVDSDDYISPDTIELAIQDVKKSQSDLVIFNFEYVSENGYPLIHKNKPIENSNKIWDQNQFWRSYYNDKNSVFCVVAWNKLYKRKLFDDLRYPVHRIHEDEFILHELISKINSISVLEQKLYFYVQREGSIMRQRNYNAEIDYCLAMTRRAFFFTNTDKQKYNTFILDALRNHMSGFYKIKLSASQKNDFRYIKKALKCVFNDAALYNVRNRLFVHSPFMYYVLNKICNYINPLKKMEETKKLVCQSSFNILSKENQQHVILLDTPRHGNLGDQAITIAEKAFINKLMPDKPFYEFSYSECSWCMAADLLVHYGRTSIKIL